MTKISAVMPAGINDSFDDKFSPRAVINSGS